MEPDHGYPGGKDKPNYYLYRWLTADDLKGTGTDPYAAAFQPRWALVAKARTEVPGTTGGITGDPYAAHSTTRSPSVRQHLRSWWARSSASSAAFRSW